MEKRIKLPSSVRKFIRTEKAQIKRQFWDAKKQAEAIKDMYAKLNPVKVIAAK